MPPLPPDHDRTLTDLPYRQCVGIALFNAHGRVWVGRRIGEDPDFTRDYRWQMPQGGIDPGEGPREAAFRELYEETGTRSAQIVGEIEDWLHYDFPPEVMARKPWRHRGQKQKWFALLFSGQDEEFDLEVHEQEFDAWRWAGLEELPELIIPFKRHIYEAVVEQFGPIAQRLAQGAMTD